MKKPNWTPTILLRVGAMAASIALPIVIVAPLIGNATTAATLTLNDALEKANPDTEAFIRAAAQIDYRDVIDTTLVGYIALAAVIAGVGSLMRAFVHAYKVPWAESVDFVGKCLAVSAATIVAVAGIMRWSSGPGAYTPATDWLVASAIIVVAGVVLYVLGLWVLKTTPKPEKTEQSCDDR